MKTNVHTKAVIDLFEIEIINSSTAELNREIKSPAIHGKGLQLGGGVKQSKSTDTRTIIGWGTQVDSFLSSLSEEKAREAIANVLNDATPLVLLSVGITDKIQKMILEEANKNRIPVSATGLPLTLLITTIGSYLVNQFAEHTDVHASLVVVNGLGVMITGKSGIGKSEAVLELIGNGHSFVSDDTVNLKRIGRKFIGTPATITKGLLEARGIGIINIPVIYGAKTVKDSTEVELVIEFIASDDLPEPDRLGNANNFYEILDGRIPLIQIPVRTGRSLAVLIEAAVNVHIARLDGVDPLKVMSERNK